MALFRILFPALFLLLSLLGAAKSEAFELRNLSINYQRFHDSNRIPDLAGLVAKEGLSLSVDTDLFWRTYWNSRIVAITDDGGYKLIGLNMHLGFKVFDNFSVEYEHFSKHLLDHTDTIYPAGKFPVQDSLGFVWVLYSKPREP